MAKYKVTDRGSGKTVQLTGDSPPTEQEINQIFKHLERAEFAGREKQEEAGEPALKERPEESSRERTRQILAEAAIKEEGPEEISDVLLDVPTLKVDEIKLVVDNLDARVALDAAVANNLVRIVVGAQVGIGKVELEIKGVEVQAVLKVKLRQVNAILSRTLDTLDRNPDLLRHLGEAVGSVGREAGRAVGELGTQVGKAIGPGGPIGETIGQVGKSIGPGGPVGETIGQVGKAVGSDSPVDETMDKADKAHQEAMDSGGNRRRTGETTERAEKVTAAEDLAQEAIRDISQGIEQTIEGESQVKKGHRRHPVKEKKRKPEE